VFEQTAALLQSVKGKKEVSAELQQQLAKLAHGAGAREPKRRMQDFLNESWEHLFAVPGRILGTPGPERSTSDHARRDPRDSGRSRPHPTGHQPHCGRAEGARPRPAGSTRRSCLKARIPNSKRTWWKGSAIPSCTWSATRSATALRRPPCGRRPRPRSREDSPQGHRTQSGAEKRPSHRTGDLPTHLRTRLLDGRKGHRRLRQGRGHRRVQGSTLVREMLRPATEVLVSIQNPTGVMLLREVKPKSEIRPNAW